jgi:hypothetical protein
MGPLKGDVSLTLSERGRARTDAQSGGDGVGFGSSRRKPPALDDTRAYQPATRGGLSCYGRNLLLVKLPSGGFGHRNAKVAGLLLSGVPC